MHQIITRMVSEVGDIAAARVWTHLAGGPPTHGALARDEAPMTRGFD